MNKETKEAIRYLGYGKHAVDDHVYAMLDECFRELADVAQKRIIYRIFELSREKDGSLRIGKMHIISKNLSKNMKGCSEVIVLGATLGVGVDMLMKRYSLTDMAKAVICQAAAAAMLEEFLDEKQREIAEKLAGEGKYLRPRFSPGYGDFGIEHQGVLLAMLDAAKTIGLTMTDGCMLTPMKSVTAVIGVSETEALCHIKGCELCDKTDCIYRRNEEC